MPLYLLVRTAEVATNKSLGNRISKRFPKSYVLDKGQWLISSELEEPDEVCKELKIDKGTVYTGTFVAKVSDYYGVHSSKLWDWLKENNPRE